MRKKLRVLISAHEIAPYLGSECSSGWNIIMELGRYHDLTLIYAKTNQFNTSDYDRLIHNYIQDNGIATSIVFLPVSQPRVTRIIAWLNRRIANKSSSVGISFLYFIGVRFWEKEVFRIASNLHSKESFDILHHFNHISFREPGFLYRIEAPFVWGPTSGFSTVPWNYLQKLPLFEMISNLVRNWANILQFNLSGRIRKAARTADLVYFVTREDNDCFRKLTNKVTHLLDMGTNTSIDASSSKRNGLIPIKVLWVGRLSSLKSLDLLLKAIGSKEVLREKISLSVVGEGPQKQYYQRVAKRLEISNILWLGQIPKDEVHALMLESELLVHTSIKEAASAVVLESLSAGLPVLCHDAFGMSYTIDNNSGIKIPFISPKVSISQIAHNLEILALDPQKLKELQDGAKRRSQTLSWSSIAKKIASDYDTVFEQSQEKRRLK